MSDTVAERGTPKAFGVEREELRGGSACAPGLYRAVWRWHFYAGLFVIPILVTLAVTGMIYLFKPQLEPLLYHDLMRVPVPDGARAVPYADQIAAVERAYPNATVARVVTPIAADASTEVFVTTVPEGERSPFGNPGDRAVYVDPYTGKVLGALVTSDMFMDNVRDLHGELMAGPWGDRIVELVASWAVVLTATGYSLWWRGRHSRAKQRAGARGRSLIRNRHARIGALTGAVLAFFIISGLPWSDLWGNNFQKLATATKANYPELSDAASTSIPPLTRDLAGGDNGAPWATEQLPVPSSDPGAGHTGHGGAGATGHTAGVTGGVATPIGVDRVAGIFTARTHPRHGFTVLMPEGETGVYSVFTTTPNNPEEAEYTNIDQYSGKVLGSYGFGDYGVLAKGVEEGIALHEGRRFGAVNLLANLALCLGVLFMAITGPMMWWRRRPKGGPAEAGFTAPRRTKDSIRMRGVLVIMVIIGVLFPLGGISMVLVLLLDRFALRRIPRLARVFG